MKEIKALSQSILNTQTTAPATKTGTTTTPAASPVALPTVPVTPSVSAPPATVESRKIDFSVEQ